ncbi:MAG: NUDIX domain-containing protein [Candidatus Korarchaeum sp.]|jgi:ADP-ribose pyrophosphatase YjhB (NUDIX family)|nr:NUDIX domain-containing protein [Candidatus Korarchaeum sp.]
MTVSYTVELRGAVIKGDSLLLIREKGKKDWSIPGDLVEPGRSFRDSLRGIISDSTGVHAEVIRAIDVSDEADAEHRIRITYLCKPVSGKLRPGRGAKEVRWVELSKATELPLSGAAREAVNILTSKFALFIRNRDLRRVIIGVPRGHVHKRVVMELFDGIIVLHEATVENIVRAFVEVEMHPSRRAIVLEGRELERRKEGYSKYQLLEVEMSDEEVENMITEILGLGSERSED